MNILPLAFFCHGSVTLSQTIKERKKGEKPRKFALKRTEEEALHSPHEDDGLYYMYYSITDFKNCKVIL